MKKWLAVLLCVMSTVTKAAIRLPSIISSNMVLQQQAAVKFWGWGDATEKVRITTSWNGKTDSTKVDENGKWKLSVQTPAAGGPYTITIKGNNTIVLQNVLIGEVWVCSGQSNMDMNYNWGLPQMKQDFPTANNPNIRLFTTPHTTAQTPQDDSKGDWILCDSNTVKSFSAAGYYFGRKLNSALNVPIGLINVSWGGTPAEVWTPEEEVNSNPVLKDAAQKLTRNPGWPITPGYTFNGMIAPITSYSIAGAIWYQGEANTGTAATYQPLLTTMITAWRKKWNNDFPFYIVQLAPFKYGNKNIAALLREAQTKTLALPKTGVAVITDLVDDTLNIHPKNKRDVGYRLAALALTNNYGKPYADSLSPFYKDMMLQGKQVVLSFINSTSGLKATDKNITGFYVAGDDKLFYPATAKIVKDKIIVANAMVPKPVAVRYAFSNAAVGNVVSLTGLPLSPFRTDDWDVDTSSVK